MGIEKENSSFKEFDCEERQKIQWEVWKQGQVWVHLCFFSPPKKSLKHSLISEVKRTEKEEEVEVEDLGCWMFDKERPQMRPERDDIQSIGNDQGMLEKRGQSFYSPRRDRVKSKDRCK